MSRKQLRILLQRAFNFASFRILHGEAVAGERVVRVLRKNFSERCKSIHRSSFQLFSQTTWIRDYYRSCGEFFRRNFPGSVGTFVAPQSRRLAWGRPASTPRAGCPRDSRQDAGATRDELPSTLATRSFAEYNAFILRQEF